MGYNPEKHHRRSIRLPGYDYTQPGAYFVTICTQNRECLFDDPVLRAVVETCWQAIPRHIPQVKLDAWVVMPNHVHGIIVVTHHPTSVGARHSQEISLSRNDLASYRANEFMPNQPRNALPLPQPMAHGALPRSLGVIVGNFKSVTARRINRIRHTPGMEVWQRNYYEHIIRNEGALQRIRKYIVNNLLRWELDIENPANWQDTDVVKTDRYYKSIWEEGPDDLPQRKSGQRG
ncbi:MAG: transposase [Anaerolineae bacterium]